MAKKIGAIVSLSLIGVLIIATIILANVKINYSINCENPTAVWVSYSNKAYNKVTDEQANKIIDYIVDESTLAPDSIVSNESMLDDIKAMLNQLSPKERDVLILRFGLDNNGVKKTLDEVGTIYEQNKEAGTVVLHFG